MTPVYLLGRASTPGVPETRDCPCRNRARVDAAGAELSAHVALTAGRVRVEGDAV